ncbi:hypothetical protein [Gordonia sihwensis]|uniref:hypothetical protein n=1 Tax=Gordonia sihwensis TaxID=173559 RepID=UPI0005F06C1E|nr:hypothetical protein [Gordonia sihwensis]KJR10494.1 hypothetical protein UG54_00395 [Gordonia sihwensis]
MSKIQDLLDRVPRWGELDGRGRALSIGGLVVLIVAIIVAGLLLGGVFSSSDQADGPTDDLPYGGGVADCDRGMTRNDAESSELVWVASGGEKGLPYRANVADAMIQEVQGNRFAFVSMCMEPKSTQEQITDTATVIAQNIKAKFSAQATLSALVVQYLGDGSTPLSEVTTYWKDHPFLPSTPVKDQRSAWEFNPNPTN